jgi:hypothetical protein
MINTFLDKVRENNDSPEKSVINIDFLNKYCSFIFIFKPTSRTQHRGAKPFRR